MEFPGKLNSFVERSLCSAKFISSVNILAMGSPQTVRGSWRLLHLSTWIMFWGNLLYLISSYPSSFVQHYILSWLSDFCRSMGRRSWMRRRPRNRLNKIVSMAPITMQMIAMDNQVYFYVSPPLKYDQLKESPRKAECYAFQDKVWRLSKLNSNFKATYSLPQTFYWHDKHAWCEMLGQSGKKQAWK